MVYNFFTSVLFLLISFNPTTKTTTAPKHIENATALTETESVYNSIKMHSASMPAMECFTIALKGFNRLTLKAGERKLVSFTLSAADLSVPDANGKITPLKGKFTLSVGGSQPDEKNVTSGNIVKKTVTMM